MPVFSTQGQQDGGRFFCEDKKKGEKAKSLHNVGHSLDITA
jgi:hypothetical protein